MSIGKFEPSYRNPYSRPIHNDESPPRDEKMSPRSQEYFNGFPAHVINGDEKKVDTAVDGFSVGKGLERYIHIEVHPNGGASVVHVYDSEIASLSEEEKEKLVDLFFKEVFREEPENVAKHVIGIVHGAVTYMPELVGYLSDTCPELDIKVGRKGREGWVRRVGGY